MAIVGDLLYVAKWYLSTKAAFLHFPMFSYFLPSIFYHKKAVELKDEE